MYGILMELLQFLISSGRSFDFFDIIANIIGAIVTAINQNPHMYLKYCAFTIAYIYKDAPQFDFGVPLRF